MLDAWIAHWNAHTFGYWAVADASRPEDILGFGGLMYKNVGHLHGLNIYFRFAPEAWGRGYASRLARASLDLAFNTLGATEVLGLVRPLNIPSRRVLERTGFIQFSSSADVSGEPPSLLYRATPNTV